VWATVWLRVTGPTGGGGSSFAATCRTTDEALRCFYCGLRRAIRTSGPPLESFEQLPRALQLLAPYSCAGKRLLLETLDYNLLFRSFVGSA
jgi:hypothetical protein